MKRVEVEQITREYDNFFKLDRICLRHEKYDGKMSGEIVRLNLHRGGAVCLLMYNPVNDTVILVEQFRYSTYVNDGPGWIIELVAGVLDEDKDLMKTAVDEAYEEAGYRVNALLPVTTFYPTPGLASEKVTFYYTEVTDQDKRGDGGGLEKEGEDIRILEVPFEEAFKKIQNGEICDGKTIMALYWLKLRQNGLL